MKMLKKTITLFKSLSKQKTKNLTDEKSIKNAKESIFDMRSVGKVTEVFKA